MARPKAAQNSAAKRRNTSEAILACERLDLSTADGVHKDPFDRMLIAQAKTGGLLFLTHDRILALYHEPLVAVV